MATKTSRLISQLKRQSTAPVTKDIAGEFIIPNRSGTRMHRDSDAAYVNITGDAMTGSLSISEGDLSIDHTTGATINFTRQDTAVVADDLIGVINWLSVDESNTSSQIAGYIRLRADTNWGSIHPEGKIEFGVATNNGAVSTKMTIAKTGNVTLVNDLFVDGGNIGLTTDTNLLTLTDNAVTIRGTYSVVSPDTATNIFLITSSVGNTLMTFRETLASEGTFNMKNAAEDTVFNMDTGSNTLNWIDMGFLGIGTATPLTTLDVDGGLALGLTAQDATYTALLTDHTIICGSGNESFTVTLPAVSTATGLILNVKNIGTGTITVDGASSETIDGSTTAVISTQYDSLTIQCDGATWWVI